MFLQAIIAIDRLITIVFFKHTQIFTRKIVIVLAIVVYLENNNRQSQSMNTKTEANAQYFNMGGDKKTDTNSGTVLYKRC
uniref:Uncharacterized protein n=1 Tax=Acrobeloides nanus TaxID=290746 RepID=A0A914CF99_9BILA